MRNITVINAYGDKNIGDAAILEVALKFIREAYGDKSKISVLSENTKSLTNFIRQAKNISTLQLPYGYAIRDKIKKASMVIKTFRFFNIFLTTYTLIFMHRLLNIPLPQKDFYSYISRIKTADIVIGMGGGYFTTNSRKDYFGLLLSLLSVYVAKFYKKRIIFLPMSFGPFATKGQERAAYHSLRNTTIMARDNITLKQIKDNDKDDNIKTFYAPDLALFTSTKKFDIAKKLKSNYIVLTAREWFADNRQQVYEDSLVELIEYAWREYRLKTVFVPMARNVIEDDDNKVAAKLLSNIKDKKIFSVFNPNSLSDFQILLGNARLAVCTRMHSAILATTTETPFVAIGYGHKTLGFVISYNIEKWHVDIKDTGIDILKTKFNKLLIKKNYLAFINTIKKKRTEIRKYKSIIIDELSLRAN